MNVLLSIFALALTAIGAMRGARADLQVHAALRALGALGAAAAVVAFIGAQLPLLTAVFGLATCVLLAGAAGILFRLLRTQRAGRRWRWWVVAFLAIAATVPLNQGELGAGVTFLTLIAFLLPLPWLDRSYPLRARARLLAAALALLIAGTVALKTLLAETDAMGLLPRLLRLLGGFGLAFAATLALRLLWQFPGLIFDRFRLRTRLITSYILVAAVPVLLIATFLLIGAYLAMAAYRAATAARLLAPDDNVARALSTLIADPTLAGALAGDGGTSPENAEATARELDRAAAERLGGGAEFILATRRERADTTRFVLHWAPRAQVPAALASLREPIPSMPKGSLVFAGDEIYATSSVEKTTEDDELLLTAFIALDSQRLSDVAKLVEAELELITTDSVAVGSDTKGFQISFGDEQQGTPRRVLSGSIDDSAVAGSPGERKGSYPGAQVVQGVAIGPAGTLVPSHSLLLVKISPGQIVASLRDTAANPINTLVLIALAVIAGLLLLVEAAALRVGAGIASRIHRAVLALHHGTRRIAEDDLDHPIALERGDELGELASAFNRMAHGLKERRRLSAERETLASELRVARTIQQRLFPGEVPQIPGLEVAGVSIPSREIGGDSYDYLRWGEGLLVSVADVAGKGVPAALLMSNLQAGLRGQAHRPAALGQVLQELNALIFASTDPGRFITLAIANIDPVANRLVYANAGHNAPLVCRRDGTIEFLAESGLLLGVLANAEYDETETSLAPGDTLVLYTDGVVEAQNAAGEFFGDDRLRTLLAEPPANGGSAAAIRDRIVDSVNTFAGIDGPGDDLTVVVVRRL
jgi:serine phosphatase RsbU (regulator of sigma subunit)